MSWLGHVGFIFDNFTLRMLGYGSVGQTMHREKILMRREKFLKIWKCIKVSKI